MSFLLQEFWPELVVIALTIALLVGVWLYNRHVARSWLAELDARPRPPCPHRYIVQRWTVGQPAPHLRCADCSADLPKSFLHVVVVPPPESRS